MQQFRHLSDLDVLRQAADLAESYHWMEEAKQIRRGTVPEGFSKEVGSYIALFLDRSPEGLYLWLGRYTQAKYEEVVAHNREHARRLTELRCLIAEIHLRQKESQCSAPKR